jgi:ABC-2 type transport system ATP-binding protein
MLLSCTHPTSGRALVFGRNSWEPEARRVIGYLPENHRFPTYMTGANMLDFYGALSGVDAATRRTRIPELLDQVGLDRWGTTRLSKYSKGMLQRVGLAQAILHEPQLLILDEPSDGVDPVGRKQIRDILLGLEQKGVTIFLNSHLLQEVELFCRDVAIIHKGKVALEGSVQELTAGGGYRLEAEKITDNLATELRARAKAVAANNGSLSFLFGTREEANQAVDLLRAGNCEVESMMRASNTLEEIFIRTVEQK